MKMTQGDKLGDLIKEAVDGGWSPTMDKTRSWTVDDILHWYMIDKFSHRAFDNDNYLKFIFNHNFAKALFGEDSLIDHAPGQLWRYHLQQSVISKDPITYLYDAVFGEK